jgi:pimeloyl-ACP methyl ester carboxylesterase
MSTMPDTRYAKSGDTYIAYQVMGEGPLDLVFVPGFVSHVEMQMELPLSESFFARLAAFCRLIRFDNRGTGLSDLISAGQLLEERMDDVRAVMDAAGSERAAMLGFSQGGTMSMLFAASYPERTSSLILYGSYARYAWAPDYPFGKTDEQIRSGLKWLEDNWGLGHSVDTFMPSLAQDAALRKWAGRFERASASPAAAKLMSELGSYVDVRHVCPVIRVPALILHRTGDRSVDVEHARYLARHIKGSRYVELPGPDHNPWAGDSESIVGEIEGFLTGTRRDPEAAHERVLATVLFTDIVDSTRRVVELGDRAWKELLNEHHRRVRAEFQRFRGREINMAGDGFLASFDGPARAVRCGQAIVEAVKELGLRIRAGVHTGECELMGDSLGGIAVHIGARIGALAAADEVLVSGTVRDLVVGSGLTFDDRGRHALKGVPGEWHLLAAR